MHAIVKDVHNQIAHTCYAFSLLTQVWHDATIWISCCYTFSLSTQAWHDATIQISCQSQERVSCDQQTLCELQTELWCGQGKLRIKGDKRSELSEIWDLQIKGEI